MQEGQFIHSSKRQVQYNDLYLRIVACVIAAHIIVVYGEKESTFEILLTPVYYIAFAGSFIIAFILFWSLRKVCIWLDKKFDWMEQPVLRVALQVFFGLVIPGLLAFMLAALYFKAIADINILHTSYLQYDFQFILLQILLINLYYVAYYFYGRWALAEQVIGNLSRDFSIEKDNVPKETFQVSKGSKNLILPVDEIAYWFRDGESNFLRTMTGEDFFIPQSLDEVQQALPDHKFFRANRQLIIHRKACKGFDLLTYGKLKARLFPAYSSEVIISQKRALAFKNWIDSKAA
jgi:hypothetical protein